MVRHCYGLDSNTTQHPHNDSVLTKQRNWFTQFVSGSIDSDCGCRKKWHRSDIGPRFTSQPLLFSCCPVLKSLYWCCSQNQYHWFQARQTSNGDRVKSGEMSRSGSESVDKTVLECYSRISRSLSFTGTVVPTVVPPYSRPVIKSS